MVGKTVDYKLNLNYDVLSLSDDEGNVAMLGSATIKDDDGKIVWNHTVTMTTTFKNGIVKEVKKNVSVMENKKPGIVKE